MIRAALDSNIFLSALISPTGNPAKIYEAWRQKRFELVTCTEQLDEIRRVSRYPKLKEILEPHLVGRMMNAMRRAHVIYNVPRTHVAADPADAYLLDLVDFSKAHYLVTGDKRSGLLQIRRVGQAAILTATEFCDNVLR